MKINKAIKFFRIKKNIPSHAMFPNHSKSYYSKLETKKSSLKIDELQLILDRLELTNSEFFAVFDDGFDGNYVEMFRSCVADPENKQKKRELLEQYYTYDNATSNNSKKLAEYFSIKTSFLGVWSETKKISSSEKKHISKVLLEKDIYTYYDYVLLANTIIYFDRRQTLNITSKMLPLDFYFNRDFETKKFAYTSYINIITARLYNRDFEEAKLYIDLAEKEDVSASNYFFKFSIQYLKNLVYYIETEDLEYLDKIYNFILLIEDIGDLKTSKLMRKEVSDFAFKEKKIKDDDFYPSTSIKEQ